MDMAPADTSGIFKQAVTTLEQCGGVEDFTSATTFVDGEGLDVEGTLERWMGDFTGFTRNTGKIFLSVSKPGLAEELSPVAITGQDGCNTLSHPMNFVVCSLGYGSGTGGVFGMSVGEGVIKPFFSYASGTATPQKTSSS